MLGVAEPCVSLCSYEAPWLEMVVVLLLSDSSDLLSHMVGRDVKDCHEVVWSILQLMNCGSFNLTSIAAVYCEALCYRCNQPTGKPDHEGAAYLTTSYNDVLLAVSENTTKR